MDSNAPHGPLEKSLADARELLTEVERVLAIETEERKLPDACKRAIFEGMMTARDRIFVALGDLASTAIKQRDTVGLYARERASLTTVDRECVQLYQPTLQLGRRLMEGQDTQLNTHNWGARSHALHLDNLLQGVTQLRASGLDLSNVPHVRQMLREALEHWRAELAHVMEEHTVQDERKYGRGPDRTYAALFARVTAFVQSLNSRVQVGSKGFARSRRLRQGERLVPGFGHSNFLGH